MDHESNDETSTEKLLLPQNNELDESITQSQTELVSDFSEYIKQFLAFKTDKNAFKSA